MHAGEVLQRTLGRSLADMHGRRRAGLLKCVDALANGRRLTLTDLARSWLDAERIHAPMKRVDRLLSNPHLHAEMSALYAGILDWMLRQRPRPIIVVDWSELGRRTQAVLRAGLAVDGRTVTLYEIVTPKQQMNSPGMESQLLRWLEKAMPPGVKPILLTDAGFVRPWFRKVAALGWDFVGRIRSNLLVRPAKRPLHITRQSRKLYALADRQTRELGNHHAGRRDSIEMRLVLHRKPRKGRVDKTVYGDRVRETKSRQCAARESEPWLLATSLSRREFSAARVAKIYAKRMQIEQSFRDLKSHRYGVAFDDSLTRKTSRISVLLLIHALMVLAAWIVYRYVDDDTRNEAISTMTRLRDAKTLSWHRIGMQLLKLARFKLHAAAWRGTG